MRRVVVANDHGAVEVANKVVEHLKARGFEVDHLGVYTNDSVDYPDKAAEACKKFLGGGYEFGVLACGTGIGISISANKINGIICALPQNTFAAEMAKCHNNANFIAFGGRIEYCDPVEEMLDAFIDHDFEGGRHAKRVDKIMALESQI
ncbi:MAG: RpiB/LacA/LacB family sugar-phosphate isomerase [Sphaerochaetaceae bacterium]|jgi:ribose 5-phosphate isomerase B|nr:RpiB/LacA/LacB family sugar-phosphate isomerase [Sphaerochaetaceae bacterium]HHU88743.1 RpiB/LacA/LacB family sugar-phosphate isomerase [Spirochaetales bacterium]